MQKFHQIMLLLLLQRKRKLYMNEHIYKWALHLRKLYMNEHIYEWALHLRNNLFGRFCFSLDSDILLNWNGGDFLGFGWLKHVLKCHDKWFRNHVPLHNFIENDSTKLAIFVQIASYFNHK